MRVLLVSCSKSFRSYALRILSACLKQQGHDVRMVFFSKEETAPYSDDELSQLCTLAQGFDLVGLSVLNYSLNHAIAITQALKSCLPTPVIWGGVYPTIDPEGALQHADLVCVGEGEVSFLELARRMTDNCCYSDIPGIWSKSNDGIVRTGSSPLPQNLDELPYLDYDCTDDFVLTGSSLKQIDHDVLSRKHGPIYQTLTTRGCAYDCSYCCNNALKNIYKGQTFVRIRSVDDIIDELEGITKQFGFISSIHLVDDLFFIRNEQSIRDFSEEYKQRINLPLHIYGLGPAQVSKERLSPLVDAGMVFVRMGIQTGSQRTKALYKRFYSNEDILRATQIIHGFYGTMDLPSYDIIVDNPWETEQDLVDTLQFLRQIPVPYTLNLFSLTLFPNTALHKKAVEEGLDFDSEKHTRILQNTFLNKMFVLLKKYAAIGQPITKTEMTLLTNKFLRVIRVSDLVMLYMNFRIRNAPGNASDPICKSRAECSSGSR